MAQITFLRFPTQLKDGPSIKVPGIKALRGITGITLKEAKEIIEDLQSDKSFVCNVDVENVVPFLNDFKRLGGEFTIDNSLYDSIKQALNLAIDQGELPVASDLLDALKKLKH